MRSLEIAALAVSVAAVAALASLYVGPYTAARLRRVARKRRTWFIAVPSAIVALTLVAPFIYTRVVIGPPPKPLSFADLPDVVPAPRAEKQVVSAASVDAAQATPSPTASSAAQPATKEVVAAIEPSSPLAGEWVVGTGSQAGYSIDDKVMGQTTRVVGRTTRVEGSATIDGTKGTAARVVVNMASVQCNCVHDDKYRDLLEVEKYPTATFVLDTPITVSKIPPAGTVVTIPVKGRFTIHGVTRTERFNLQATQKGERIAVNGSIPVRLEDYDIENPDAGPFASLANPAIDLLLAFDKKP